MYFKSSSFLGNGERALLGLLGSLDVLGLFLSIFVLGLEPKCLPHGEASLPLDGEALALDEST